MLTFRRSRRPIVFLCLAATVLAVLLPGVTAADVAILPPGWVMLPELAPLDAVSSVPAGAEQRLALRTALPPRAPPFPV